VSQHITLPFGGQKGAISAFLDLRDDPLFAEVKLNCGASSLMRMRMIDRDKD